MAKRVDGWESGTHRYPWEDWTDGSIWEIVRGEDYEVPTENMRVNLHERAKVQRQQVKTAIFRRDQFEGLRFQFIGPALVRLRPLSQDRRYPVNDPRRFQMPAHSAPVNTRVRISAGRHGDVTRIIDVSPDEFQREYDEHGENGEMWLRDRRSDDPDRSSGLTWRIAKPTILDWEATNDAADPIAPG